MVLVGSLDQTTAPERSPRDDGGRYSTVRNPLVLFEIVREVALVAARRDASPFKDPAAVSQAAWNGARALLVERYGHIPQANEVCRQLADRDGKPWPWRELLAIGFDPDRDPKKTWEERLSEPDRPVTPRHVYFALNFVNQQLGPQTRLRYPHQYEEARAWLLREASAQGTSVEALKQRLPTRGQIETACGGNWERALEVAKLQPVSRGAVRSVVEAMLHFYEAEGYLPTKLELVETARRNGTSLEQRAGRSWLGLIEEAEREAERRGLSKPPPYGTRPAAKAKGARDGGGEAPMTKGFYSRVEVLQWLQEFSARLPPRTVATDDHWREFQRGCPGVPSLNVIKRHGGLSWLLVEASRPGWRERAEEVDRQAIPPPGRRGRPRSQAPEQLLAVIGERGEVSARELAEATELSMNSVRYFLRQLKKAGQVETTNPKPRVRNQRYRLPSTSEATDE